MVNSFRWLFILASLIVALPSFATGVVELRVKKEAKFDVVYDRADSSSTGAVIGGLIGAAIEEGVRGSKDTEKKNLLLGSLDDSTCTARIVNALEATLLKSEYALIRESSGTDSTLRLELSVRNCGFKMVNTITGEASAYVKMTAELFVPGVKKPRKQEVYVTGKNQYLFESLVSEKDSINEEFSYVLSKAGKKLANKIIYRR